jgi:hypothetical protein
MLDARARSALLALLGRGDRHRLANRAIACGLFAACAYLALLLALLAFHLPLLVFHLLFYCCLALLPLFLILDVEEDRTRTDLRRIDDRCQVESYLSAGLTEQRAFLEPRVLDLLERRAREKALPFRLHPWNLRLAVAAAGLLFLFLAAGWLAFGSLRPTLSAAALVSRRAETLAWEGGFASGGSPPGPQGRSEATGAASEASESHGRAEEAGSVGAAPRDPRGAGRAMSSEENEAVTVGEAEALPPEQEGAQAAGGLLEPEAAEPSGRGLAEAMGEGRAMPLRPGGSEAGTGSTGRSLLESPLQEYRSRADRAQAEGGQSLAADSGRTSPLAADLPPAGFADLPVPIPTAPGFDPEIQRLGRRYLELLDERY